MHQKGIKSLSEISQVALIKNASNITWLGVVPFKLIENVLKKLSPKQLQSLEQWNPQLTEETDILWKSHCINDFSDLKRLFNDGALPEPDSWRSLYNLKKSQMDEKTQRMSEKLRGMKQEEDIKKNSRNAKLLDQAALSRLTVKKGKSPKIGGSSTPPIKQRKLGMIYQQTLKDVSSGSLFGSISAKNKSSSSKRSEAANLFLGSNKKQRRK